MSDDDKQTPEQQAARVINVVIGLLAGINANLDRIATALEAQANVMIEDAEAPEPICDCPCGCGGDCEACESNDGDDEPSGGYIQ